MLFTVNALYTNYLLIALDELKHPREWVNRHLFHSRRRSAVGRVACTVVRSVTLECTRKVINPLYHCRHSVRHNQYEYDSVVTKLLNLPAFSSSISLIFFRRTLYISAGLMTSFIFSLVRKLALLLAA